MLFTKQNFDLKATGLFSALFKDYIFQSTQVKPFYNNHFNTSSFSDFLSANLFNDVDRITLVNALEQQAQLVNNTTPQTQANIKALFNANVFSVTTGHQLCLFTGPLYFIYKIVSTINLAKELAVKFPDKQFVPVYWMASEDHDFEEINHVNVFSKRLEWKSEQKGSVGDFKTNEVEAVIQELKLILGNSAHADELIVLFETAYLKQDNLAHATRFIVNALFGAHGLITLDGDDKHLKQLVIKEFEEDIFNNVSEAAVNDTIKELLPNYSAQVNPRTINVFYKEHGLRERIEQEGDVYKVLNTPLKFTEKELKELIHNSPEKISPNVVLRPLYQQKILPNVAYVGGPGELAYWLEYKKLFEVFGISMPVLVPRHFVLYLDKGTQQKMQKFNFSFSHLFNDGEELVKQFIKTQHADINLENQKNELLTIYNSALQQVEQIDKTLIASVEAEKQKAINGLSALEQKINRSLKQKSEIDVNQIWGIKQKLFPNTIPQERYDNFASLYAKYGMDFINELLNALTYDLDKFEYTILEEK